MPERLPGRLVQLIVLVADLNDARRAFEGQGFAVFAGGRHPGRGTANLIIPFDGQYLELLAIVDDEEADRSDHGRPVLAAWHRRGPGLARWSVESNDIDGTAARLSLPVERRQRVRPDGVTVRWRSVGVDEAWAEPWRCAFMSWDDPTTHPGQATLTHPNGATGFASLEVEVPEVQTALAWTGSAPDMVVFAEGPRAGRLQAAITTPSGPLPL